METERWKLIMPIWKLDPIDLTDRNWAASTHKSAVVIRSSTEDRARQIAQSAFATGISHTPGETLPVCPWKYPNLVVCHQSIDTDHDEDGPEAVLFTLNVATNRSADARPGQ